jgi:hypothetical protein
LGGAVGQACPGTYPGCSEVAFAGRASGGFRSRVRFPRGSGSGTRTRGGPDRAARAGARPLETRAAPFERLIA